VWVDLAIVALLLFGVYAFAQLASWRTQALTSRSDRRAEDLYDRYADSERTQRRHANEHSGERTDSARQP
jgi:hypothetical protein